MPPLPNDLRHGLDLQKAGKLAEAGACYERILRREPGNATVLHLLGVIRLATGRIGESVVLFRRCLSLRPQFPEALTNLGRALLALNKPLEALEAHERALTINPRLAEIHGNLGNTLKFLHRTDEAIDSYRRALEIWPDSADLKYNIALVYLLKGDLLRGWEGYESRWDRKKSSGRRPLSQPRWQGKSSLEGKSLFVYAEQGLGDTLQFARYVPLLTGQGAAVRLEVQPSLKALLSAQFPGTIVSAKGELVPPFDLHCPLLSLPGAWGTELDSIPGAVPYLRAPADRAAEWRRRLAEKKGLNIGLTWSGSAAHQSDRHRSIPLAVFSEAFCDLTANFYSLQKEARPGDAAALASLTSVTDLGPQLQDFSDTAAVVANLDLVITVDTAVAHLAGALGVRTWLLLPFAPDWRWLLDRRDSPWYPSIRLYRQSVPGDWNPILKDLRFDLGNLLGDSKV